MDYPSSTRPVSLQISLLSLLDQNPAVQAAKISTFNPTLVKPDLHLKSVRVRRSAALQLWIVTDRECTEVTHRFVCGILTGVEFDNRAPVMNFMNQMTVSDVKVQNLQAFIVDGPEQFEIPKTIKYTASLSFLPAFGLVIKDTTYVVATCDILFVNSDGKSIACWFTKPENAP